MTAPITKIKQAPVAKLRSLSNWYRKNDLGPAVAVCARKYRKLTPARMASMRISSEPNQSSCSPRSSMAWSAPMARPSVMKPNASNFTARAGARLGRKDITPNNANAPIGTLMKNTHRQL